MIRFKPNVIYYWFPDQVEAKTPNDLIKYQFIKTVDDVDFNKYHVGIFETEYPFTV